VRLMENPMSRAVSLALALSLAASGLAFAQEMTVDPIKARQTLMATNGAAAAVGAGILKGEIPYDPRIGNLVLASFVESAHLFHGFFPENSKEGGETEASPKIWEDAAGFAAANQKFQADADAAAATKPQNLEAFKAAFTSVAANCKSCHDAFRVAVN